MAVAFGPVKGCPRILAVSAGPVPGKLPGKLQGNYRVTYRVTGLSLGFSNGPRGPPLNHLVIVLTAGQWFD